MIIKITAVSFFNQEDCSLNQLSNMKNVCWAERWNYDTHSNRDSTCHQRMNKWSEEDREMRRDCSKEYNILTVNVLLCFIFKTIEQ